VPGNLRVVIDTQIFLRSVINPRSASAKLSPKLWRGYYQLYISDAIEAEIIDVLNRIEIRAKFPQITDETVNDLLTIIQSEGERIEVTEVEPISRDPKDDMFLACAKVAGADYLVSEDKDLLVLEKHHDTKIVNVAQFLSVMENLKTPLDRPAE
jgi:uncharacterized protein